jgi:serine O-acetyltransferase
MFNNLKADLERYYVLNQKKKGELTLIDKLKIIWNNPGILAILTYRYCRWVRYSCKVIGLRKVLSIIGTFMFKSVEIMYGIHIRSEIDIGPGLYIGHFGNIFVGGKTKIGKNCNISQGVTIGWAGRGEEWGLPEIGDNVYIGPGAKILGKIKIGDNVAIGANAVVTKDLPDNAVAGGVPAKIISYKGSKDFVITWD